jgi:hypothetical protein
LPTKLTSGAAGRCGTSDGGLGARDGRASMGAVVMFGFALPALPPPTPPVPPVLAAPERPTTGVGGAARGVSF